MWTTFEILYHRKQNTMGIFKRKSNSLKEIFFFFILRIFSIGDIFEELTVFT